MKPTVFSPKETSKKWKKSSTFSNMKMTKQSPTLIRMIPQIHPQILHPPPLPVKHSSFPQPSTKDCNKNSRVAPVNQTHQPSPPLSNPWNTSLPALDSTPLRQVNPN